MDIGALINNQYEVIEHIGRGGMADVWSARDQRLRRMVAIKTIAAGLAQDVDPITLFQKEAQTIAQMEHPHILPIYDFGEYDNSLYIVMRYVTGGSLEDELQDGSMDMADIMRLGDAVAKALDYAHSNNIIHLDLKPPNILLDSGGSPYLADFGLATVLDKQGRAENPGSGTLLYMAPEQLTSDTIDHRADVYAFTIMLFHMMTGQLPFEGRVPLAMQQLQAGDTLPYVDEINEAIPHEVNAIVRKGTEKDPYNRYATHGEVMDAIREIVQPASASWTATGAIPELVSEPYQLETQQVETSDSALLEAIDLYSRARYNWQAGQGRFLLGVTHFMLMSGYYQDAVHYGLAIDHEGYQMLLRGALEYDYELDYWWKQVTDADRRWVCLHALRSGNSPARIRALYRLETLPDDAASPVIPRLVAQTLEIEVDNTAKRAALKVLGTRAKLMKRPTLSIKTEFRGRLLTSMTRLGIHIGETAQWQEAVYSPEVDTLIAEQAFDEDADVGEFAARTVGRMRSLAGVSYLAQAQVNGRHGSLEALAFVRDEAPALPDVVSPQARFYAWVANTVHRLTDKPLEGILRVVLALLGGWLAMGEFVYNVFRSEQLFTAQRWGNTIAVGLIFGVFIAITYLVTEEMSRRLQGFWTWWQRLLVSGLLGFVMGTLSFGGFTWMYYQYTPPWDMMRMVGMALAFAFVLSGLLDLRGWRAIILTTILTFTPLLITHQAWYFSQESTIVFVAPLALYIGLFAGWRAAQLSSLTTRLQLPGGTIAQSIVGIVIGAVWALAIWLYFATVHDNILAGNPLTWDSVSWLFLGMFMFGLIIAYPLAKPLPVTLLAVAALAVFFGIYAAQSWQFFDYTVTIPVSPLEPVAEFIYYSGMPLSPIAQQPIFHFDETSHIFSVVLPMVFVIALGVNIQPLFGGWWAWIGSHEGEKVRGGWLTSMLIYTLTVTALSSVLALFSAKVDVLWALGWSLGTFITFIFALATIRWARWGAYGLVGSAVAFVLGGFFFDAVNMRYHASLGRTPELLRAFPIDLPLLDSAPVLTALVFWAIWSVLIGVFTWGALRQRLWAGIGLVVMLIGWYIVAIFTPIQGSMAVFAITNVALLLYALKPQIDQMETGRFSLPSLFPRPQQTITPKHEDAIATVRVVSPNLADKSVKQHPAKVASVANKERHLYHPHIEDELDMETHIINQDASLTDLETDEINRLLAESDVHAADFTSNDNDNSEMDTIADADEINRLLAESDVHAADFTSNDNDNSEMDTIADADEINRLLAESDVNAASFMLDEEDELSDSQLQTEIMFPRDDILAHNAIETGSVEEDDAVNVEDGTNLDTEQLPSKRNLSDSNILTTEDLPKVKDSQTEDDDEDSE
ncbi:MAG: protein kinase [Anaerolineae bacterium]|nr:protein kinase [Anaerolineae bacterium]MDQ7035475.1 protein kinase [Anaerolineae bacterium]